MSWWYATLWLGRWEVHRIERAAGPWGHDRRQYAKVMGPGRIPKIFCTLRKDDAERAARILNEMLIADKRKSRADTMERLMT